MRRRPDARLPVVCRCAREIEHLVGPHPSCEIEAIGGRADREHATGAGDPRERDRTQPDRSRALHQHALPRLDRGAIQNVGRGEQAASAADVGLDTHGVGQPCNGDPRLEINRL